MRRKRLAVFLLHNLGHQLYALAQFIDRQAQTAERLAQTLVEPVASLDATVAQPRIDAYVPDKPPTHWLQRVRQDAPHLLEPQEQETIRGTLSRWPRNKSDIPGPHPMKIGYPARRLESEPIDNAPELESGNYDSIERVDDEPFVAKETLSNNATAPNGLLAHRSKRQTQGVTHQSKAAAQNEHRATETRLREQPIRHGHQAAHDALITPMPLRPLPTPTQSSNPDWLPVDSKPNMPGSKPVVQPVQHSPKQRKETIMPVSALPETVDGSRQKRTGVAASSTRFQPQIAAALEIQPETAVSEPDPTQKPLSKPEHQPALATQLPTPSRQHFPRNDDSVVLAEDRTTSSDYQPARPDLETQTESMLPLVENMHPSHTEPSTRLKSNANGAVHKDLGQDRVSQSRTTSPPTQPRHHQNHQAPWPWAGQPRPHQANHQPDTYRSTKHQPVIESDQAERHNRWHLLPTAEQPVKETGEQIWQSWKRRQRLNHEQRGFEWNG